MAERLFVRLEGDPSPCGPETTAPAGTLCAGSIHPRLRGHVDGLLTYREDLDPSAEVEERVLPDGAVGLSFNLGDAPSVGPGPGFRVEAIGATSAPALVRLRGRMEGVTVRLRPGAAFAILGVPAGELEGSAVDLDTLWRGEGSRLLERMAGAQDAARFALLNEALLRRLSEARDQGRQQASRAAALVAASNGRLTVKALAEAVGVGERRLQQLFHLHVGVSPRTWARLKRMEACLRQLRQRPRPDWARLAAEAGYYDQSHLTNEFRALCGVSPKAFLEQAVSGSSKTEP